MVQFVFKHVQMYIFQPLRLNKVNVYIKMGKHVVK